jgi:MFS transporter, ACDE family, multidrug resistance protein
MVGLSKGTAFAGFFFLTALAQTITLTVLPLEALRLLGDAGRVSIVYSVVGIASFAGRLAIPGLTERMGRFGVLVLGTASLCLSVTFLALAKVGLLVAGLIMNVFALACLEIVLNLYVLDNISRHELAQFEAKRIFSTAAPYTFGPWLGIHLQLAVAPWIPFAISAGAAATLLLTIWRYRVALAPTIGRRPRRPYNPLVALHRFFAQPRLRLAWILAVTRSAWWGLFQIYTPIFAVEAGFGGEIGGALVSVGLGWIWTVLMWGWLGRRFGQRRLLRAGYAIGGVLTIAAALMLGTSWFGAAILILAAFAVESIDGAGNTLFLRAVHVHERSTMTAIFITYRDVAQLAPPAVFAVLLVVFKLPAVFVGGGVMMLGSAILTRYIPRRF